ncbi:MAG: PAS domain S-box protein, partial [Anaerolineae bacterium]|nr:PAS domain S-box protein [Anaerolineae bacterium]
MGQKKAHTAPSVRRYLSTHHTLSPNGHFMSVIPRLLLCFFIVSMMAGTALDRHPAVAQPDIKRVLILNSYHPGLSWSDGEMAGVQAALPDNVELSIEYMDAKRISTPSYWRLLYETYALKYRYVPFDVIITLDDDAFQFMLEYHDRLFLKTPVVFCGVSRFDPEMVAGRTLFTGIVQTIAPVETIEIGLKLRPNATHVLAITDNTTTGENDRDALESLIAEGKIPVAVTFLDEGSGLTLAELLEKVRSAPQNSILYYADFYRDAAGEVLAPEEVIALVSETSPVPVFVHSDMYMGYGAVGGKVVSSVYQGEAAGGIAAQLLQGKPISHFPIQLVGPTTYIFDAIQLKRWDIPDSALPEGSRIINQDASLADFYEQYKKFILGILLFIVAQTAIIAALGSNIVSRRKAERALRVSEERLKLAIEGSNDGLWDWNVATGAVYLSSRWETMLGFEPGEVIGHVNTWEALLHPDDLNYVRPILATHMEGQTPYYETEYRMRAKSGDWLWVLDRGKVVERGASGEPLRAVGTHTDITDRKRTEEALRIKDHAIASSLNAIAISDLKGKLTYANPSALKMWGYAEESEILGRPILSFWRDTDKARKGFAALQLSGGWSGELVAKRKDDTVFDAQLAANIVTDTKGNPICMMASFLDITERKQAEKQLQQQAKRLYVLRKIDQGILQAHTTEKIAQVALHHIRQMIPCVSTNVALFAPETNQITILAVDADSSIGIKTGMTFSLKAGDTIAEEVMREFQQGEIQLILDPQTFSPIPPEIHILQQEGLCSILTIPLITEEQLIGFLSLGAQDPEIFGTEQIEVASEVADQLAVALQQAHLHEQIRQHAEVLEQRVKERTAQLEAINAELNDFAHIVSHDLKAPLRGLSQLSGWLLNDYEAALDEEGKNLLYLMVQRTQRMHALIDGILHYARVGRTSETEQPVDLKKLLPEIIES